ncbi:hypothetical protein QTG56_24355 (plasmid) [Rossellomorea sp. AcN35-11]|nr:hypothetical protein [Rossellomorea aquimaris]WJV31768.1 hypothetical protein QTG56_24355 [Rossellomorea sp. AcN35-11]
MNECILKLLDKELMVVRHSEKKFWAYDFLSEHAEGVLKTELEALAAQFYSLSNKGGTSSVSAYQRARQMEEEIKKKYFGT